MIKLADNAKMLIRGWGLDSSMHCFADVDDSESFKNVSN